MRAHCRLDLAGGSRLGWGFGYSYSLNITSLDVSTRHWVPEEWFLRVGYEEIVIIFYKIRKKSEKSRSIVVVRTTSLLVSYFENYNTSRRRVK